MYKKPQQKDCCPPSAPQAPCPSRILAAAKDQHRAATAIAGWLLFGDWPALIGIQNNYGRLKAERFAREAARLKEERATTWILFQTDQGQTL